MAGALVGANDWFATKAIVRSQTAEQSPKATRGPLYRVRQALDLSG
jgi:hypothetical protein